MLSDVCYPIMHNVTIKWHHGCRVRETPDGKLMPCSEDCEVCIEAIKKGDK